MIKRILTTLFIFTCCLNSFAQNTLKGNKLFDGRYNSVQEPYRTILDFVEHDGHKIMLSTNYNLYMLISLSWGKSISDGLKIHKLDSAKGKIKDISLGKEFDKCELSYLGHLNGVNGHIKFFVSTKARATKSPVVLSIDYDGKTDAVKVQKVFENPKGSSAKNHFKMIINEDKQEVAFVDLLETRNSATCDYVVKDFDMNEVTRATDLQVENVKPDDIYFYTLTKDGEVVIATTTKAPKKNLLARKTYVGACHVLSKKGVQKIDLNIAEVYSKPVFARNMQGDVVLCCTYGSDNKDFDGIYFATIDCKNGTLKNDNKKSFDDLQIGNKEGSGANASDGKSRRDLNNLKSKSNVITAIKFAPNGNMLTLVENVQITVTTTTTSSKQGVSTSTKTDYRYGPGTVYNFDVTNGTLLNLAKFDYMHRYPTDPGVGFIFEPGNGKIFLQQKDGYLEYPLDNTSKRLKGMAASQFAGAGKAILKTILGSQTAKVSSIFTCPGSAYQVQNGRKSVSVKKIKLDS
jgi:hypothetical protein